MVLLATLRLKKVIFSAIISSLLVAPFTALYAGSSHISRQWNGVIIQSTHHKFTRTSSGVPVSNCHVLSNEHVVRDTKQAIVFIAGRKYSNSTVVATDHANDLSLIFLPDCPIRKFASLSNVEPHKGDKLVSVYQERGFITGSRITQSTGLFEGYKNIITEEDRHMLSMVIDDKEPRKGASGGGVISEHGLVSVIFGVVNNRSQSRTFAVNYDALKRFLTVNHIQ
ncbi:MAG: Unknown protein [uncultured Thiotrichaceae bacterium]|uniref:Serine protease n=1 Tax=uncultured Thiotrichaceae bacterium TaxID=298394 RepID=A0A6S6SJ85_9GAMM|nr:MAG: Unknown protein [uncultured Thiotrichaceae bacterium]